MTGTHHGYTCLLHSSARTFLVTFFTLFLATLATPVSVHKQERQLRGHQSASFESGVSSLGGSPDPGSHLWEPRVFFLFLTRYGIFHERLWEDFFSSATPGRWRALVHCTDSKRCSSRLAKRNLIGMVQVATVDSQYCYDLVSPMIQLLQAATAESTSPGDKFAFISDETLPVKPFTEIYSSLTASRTSDFCIAPSMSWGTMSNAQGEIAKIVKHSQWFVLNREHADIMIERWPVAKSNPRFWTVPLWPQETGAAALVPRNLSLCTDEWTPMALVYGMILGGQEEEAKLPEFNSDKIELRGKQIERSSHGVCRTFVSWGRNTPGTTPEVLEILDAPGIKVSCMDSCTTSHPALIEEITDDGLSRLRRSPFLFARKIQINVVSQTQFRRLILDGGVRSGVPSYAHSRSQV